jgi:hypothetical protein
MGGEYHILSGLVVCVSSSAGGYLGVGEPMGIYPMYSARARIHQMNWKFAAAGYELTSDPLVLGLACICPHEQGIVASNQRINAHSRRPRPPPV